MPELPPLSLYIHLPWCERKCPYCDFNSHEVGKIPEADYVSSLLLDLRADIPHIQDRSIDSIFIGGGTPSLFSVAAFVRLMQGVGDCVALSSTLEVTMEANPGSAEAEKFHGFREAGVNRLSLGIQSFNDEQLQALGRVHNSDEAHAAIEMVRSAKFDNFNIDLMHGLPRQTQEAAESDLQTALTYRPPHLSWYQLTVEPNTVFYKQPPPLPVEDTLAEIQDAGETILSNAGYSQYEVSAYSQPNRSCLHNLNYWSFGDYLGIGAGAHGKVSFPDGRISRYSKRRQPAEYMAATDNGFIAKSRVLQHDEIAGEYMLNALRLNEGFALTQFSTRTGLPVELIQERVDKLIARNLLISAGGKIRATNLGRRFLDSVIAEFF